MSNIKRFTKRGLSVFLALVMCLSLLPTAAFAADNNSGVTDNVTTRAFSNFYPLSNTLNIVSGNEAQAGWGKVVLTDENPTATDLCYTEYWGSYMGDRYYPLTWDSLEIAWEYSKYYDSSIASATVKAGTYPDNGRPCIEVTITKGTKAGTTIIPIYYNLGKVGTEAGIDGTVYGAVSGYIFYEVTNNAGGTVTPEPDPEGEGVRTNHIWMPVGSSTYLNIAPPKYNLGYYEYGYGWQNTFIYEGVKPMSVKSTDQDVATLSVQKVLASGSTRAFQYKATITAGDKPGVAVVSTTYNCKSQMNTNGLKYGFNGIQDDFIVHVYDPETVTIPVGETQDFTYPESKHTGFVVSNSWLRTVPAVSDTDAFTVTKKSPSTQSGNIPQGQMTFTVKANQAGKTATAVAEGVFGNYVTVDPVGNGVHKNTQDASYYVYVYKVNLESKDAKTYTVNYTDGVTGKTVFADQGYESLKEGDKTPAFEGELSSYTDGAGDTYTFQGWSPAVNHFVSADDADEYGVITYTATWKKNLQDLTVTKTPSEEYPVVGEEFTYTIKMENTNATALTGVTITDVLNEKLTFVAAGDGGTYNEGNRTVTWNNVTVPANGSKDVKVGVKANAAGEISNEAKAEWDDGSTSGNTTVTAKDPEPTIRTFKVIYYNESGANWMTVGDSAKAGFLNMPEWQQDEGVTENPHEMKISDKKPTRNGYTFLHWQWGGDVNSTFKPGDTITLTANPETLTEVAADLYAVWKENPTQYTYTLTYDKNDGSDDTTFKTVTQTSTATSVDFQVGKELKDSQWILFNAPKRDGYTFVGWAEAADANEAMNADKVTLDSSNRAKTVYAVWTARTDCPYTVEWYEVGKDEPFNTDKDRTGTVGTEVSVTDLDKNVEGYTFDADNTNNKLKDILAASGTVLKLYFTKDEVKEPKISEVDKKVSTTVPVVGQEFTYTITVTNSGNAEASNVTVTDTLPEGLTVVEISDNGINENGTITWTVSIPASSTKDITVKVTANEGTAEKALVNTATVNELTDTVIVTPKAPEPVLIPEITVDKQGDKAAAKASEKVNYTITVTNTGDIDLYNLTITDDFANGNLTDISDVKVNGFAVEDVTPGAWGISGLFAKDEVITLTYTATLKDLGENVTSSSYENNADAVAYPSMPEPAALILKMVANGQQKTVGGSLIDESRNDGVSGSDKWEVTVTPGGSGGDETQKYTVTYNWGLPSGASVPADVTLPKQANYKKDDSVTVANTSAFTVTVGEGENAKTYEFSGWSSTDADITSGTFSMPAKDVTINGTWTEKVPEYWTILYKENEDTAPAITNKVEKGDSTTIEQFPSNDITIPDGKEFVGWSTDPEATPEDENIYKPGNPLTPTGDMIFYPVWKDKEPGAPEYDDLKDLVKIVVNCGSKATHDADFTETYGLLKNSYEQVANGDGSFTLTVDPDLYVAEFNKLHSGHEIDSASVVDNSFTVELSETVQVSEPESPAPAPEVEDTEEPAEENPAAPVADADPVEQEPAESEENQTTEPEQQVTEPEDQASEPEQQVTESDNQATESDEPKTEVSGATGSRAWVLKVSEKDTITFTVNCQKAPEITYTVTYTDGVNGQAFANQIFNDLTAGTNTPSFSGTPARQGYTFTGWSPAVSATVTGNATYVAQWRSTGGGGSGNGGGGGGGSTNIPDNPTPLDPGTQITDPDVPLAVAPGLNSTDHFAYIIGYPDGTVRPQGNITRAEVATIFFRLMTDEFRTTNWASTNSFPDVASASLWYNNAVSTAAKAGLLKGKEDGNFHPSQNITRAEFATIAARFLSDEEITAQPFPDTVGHWAEKDIIRAVQAGWIKGDSDGNFRPNDPITRAEAMTLVNRMLDRVPDKDHMLSDMVTWPDNPESAWFYEAVQEATNSHDYERDELGVTETWTGKLADRDWSALEKEWSDAASSTGSDVADNLQK